MAKFIIEVDDDFIRESASLDASKKRMEESGDKGGFAKALFDLLAYKGINERIENGETEFHVTRDMMGDNKNKLEYWDRNVADVLMLAVMADSEKKKED